MATRRRNPPRTARNRGYVVPATAATATDRHDAAIDDYQGDVAVAAELLLADEAADILALLEQYPDAGVDEADVQRAIEQLLAELKAGAYRDAWVAKFAELMQPILEVAGDGVAASVGLAFDLANPLVDAALQARAAQLADYVGATTAGQVLDQFQAVRAARGTTGDLADALRDNVFGLSADRARTIARTESGIAYNQGELLAARQSGVIRTKTWLHSGVSDHPRDWHEDMDGETVELDDVFSNGLDVPCDPDGPPEEVINCGCTCLYSALGGAGGEGDAGDDDDG